MADPINPVTPQESANLKPFTLPAAPTEQAIKTQFGGVPGIDMTKAPKSLGGIQQEEARVLQRQQQLGQDIGANELAQKQYQSDTQAAIATQERERTQAIEAKVDQVRKDFPYPELHPTKENIPELATLFSLIGVIGMAVGGAGKMSAIGSMNSMSGMMKGWQQGRSDLWNREKQEFDKEMTKVKSIIDDAYKDADRAYKLMATDRREAEALASQSSAKMGGQIGKQILEKQGLEPYFKYLQEIKGDLNKVLDRAVKQSKAAGVSGDLPSFIKEYSGANLKDKDAQEVGISANAIGHAYALKNQVADHPEWVGRSGQIQQFFNRYVDSLNSGKPLPPDDPNLLKDRSGQEALVFAKDYASYLVDYERSLAGGAKGFTVQFQKRFNDLLSQNQFNATGFDNLMNQQIDEVVRKARVHSPDRLTKENLTKMGLKINDFDPNAEKGYNRSIGKGDIPAQPNVTQEEYAKLKPGDLYWWNGKQVPKGKE